MTASVGTNRGQLTQATLALLDRFERSRQAVARVFVPALDVFPDGAATIENVLVNAATTSASQPIQFVCGGWIVGATVSISLSSGGALVAADFGCASLAIKINGSTDVFQTGQQAEGFVSFMQLGQGLNGGNGIFRFMAPIVQQVPYQLYFKNTHTTSNYTVSASLWYCNTTSPPISD
jgi:hypothetical protein